MPTATLARRATAEGLGTFMLLVAVVGSGIIVDELAGDAAAVALLAHAGAVAAVLAAAIFALGPVSGAHFNPAVTLAALLSALLARRSEGAPLGLRASEAATYLLAQLAGAVTAVVAAHLMFGLPAVTFGGTARTGPGLWLAEAIATGGLIVVIWGVVRRGDGHVGGIALWVGGAIYATSSNCFANPAVSVARALTDTYTGIRPVDAAAFVAVQLLAALVVTPLARFLFPARAPSSDAPTPAPAAAESVR